jgi:hypothetical protein
MKRKGFSIIFKEELGMETKNLMKLDTVTLSAMYIGLYGVLAAIIADDNENGTDEYHLSSYDTVKDCCQTIGTILTNKCGINHVCGLQNDILTVLNLQTES